MFNTLENLENYELICQKGNWFILVHNKLIIEYLCYTTLVNLRKSFKIITNNCNRKL